MSKQRKFIFLFLLSITNVFAQNFPLKFRLITTGDGLSNGNITSIVQDSLGFIWLGTLQGLDRYDGYKFKKFYHLPGITNSLQADNITALTCSPDSILWIGTNSNGLTSYNPVTGKFTHYNSFLKNPDDGSYPIVTKLFCNTKGMIWLSTEDGKVFKVDYLRRGQNITLFSATEIFNYSKQKKDISVNDFIFLTKSKLLVATNKNLFLVSLNKNFKTIKKVILPIERVKRIKLIGDKILMNVETEANYYVYVSDIPTGKITSHSFNFTPFFPDPKNKSTSIPDIIKYRHKIFFSLEPFRLIGYTPDLKTKLEEQNLSPYFPKIKRFRIKPLFIDKNKHLWALTNGLGALVEQSSGTMFNTLKNIPGDSSSISATSIRQLVEDPDNGGVWITGYAGISLFKPESGKVTRYPFYLPVYSLKFVPDHKEYFLIGTDGSGMYMGNKKTGKTRFLNLLIKKKEILNKGHVFSIYIDKTDNIWLGTALGLIKFKLTKELKKIPRVIYTQLFPITYDKSDIKGTVTQIYPVNDSLVYLATENYGIIRYNLLNNTFFGIKYDPKNSSSISGNNIKIIYRTSDGNYWVGTTSGLNKWREDDFKNFRNNFERIFTKDGLPNNVIYGILEDRSNHLWLSTNLGISQFDTENFTFNNFSVNNGLANNEFNTNSYLKTSTGEMYFGGIYGLTYFNPKNIAREESVMKVVFTGIKVLNNNISPVKDISLTHEIELSHNDNTFSISFSALDYYDPKKIEYEYQLAGQNPEWINLGHNRQITFTNVSPGKYELKVRTKTPFTNWSNQTAELSIAVLPPIWKTWWMISIYVFVFLCTLYSLRKYELNRQKLKQAAELEKLNVERLMEVNKAKSDFFANISHELRTPLTLILGMLESVKPVIKKKYKDPETEEKIDIAYKSGKKQLNMVNQILNLTRIDAGEEELNASVKNIVPLLRSISSSFESLAKINELNLSFASDYEIIPVYFDADKIEKIMNNLLSNAIKFTPVGGKISISINSGLKNSDFEISAVDKRKTGRFAKIVVEDNGIGIPKEKLPHLFNRFFQADNTSTRKYEGVGIGLSLTKELVELHNGKINVESISGEGTKLIVSLPIDFTYSPDEIKSHNYELSEPLVESENRNEIPLQVAEKNGRNSVLIIEDNSDLRYYIKGALKLQYDIFEAPDGIEGMELAEREVPDLIITDVMMPNMDGYAMTKILRRNYATSHIPIIMLTARAAEDDKLTGLEAGVDAYLTKPFSIKELTLRIRKILELRENLYKKIREGAFLNPLELKINSLDQQFLGKLKETVMNEISNENFSVEALADRMALSVRQLRRKLKALIDVSPAVYIRKLRMRIAKDLLANGNGNVSQVSLEVGYSNFAAFSKAFKDEYGVPPSKIL